MPRPETIEEKTARLRALRLARDAALPRREHKDEHHRVLGLRDAMPFGKHRGKTIEAVMNDDLGYLTWLLENTDVQLGRDAEDEYYSRLDPRRPRGAWAK